MYLIETKEGRRYLARYIFQRLRTILGLRDVWIWNYHERKWQKIKKGTIFISSLEVSRMEEV